MLTLLLCTAVWPVMGIGVQSNCLRALGMLVTGVLRKRVDVKCCWKGRGKPSVDEEGK